MSLSTSRSIKERIFHALTFEFFAIIFTAIIGIVILKKDIAAMWVLSVMISVTALILNIVFNWLFDKFFPFVNGDRSVKLRMLHAAGFEATLIIFTVPMIAYMLKVSFVEAFFIEIGILIFFLFYTYTYNWLYDRIRRQIVAKAKNDVK